MAAVVQQENSLKSCLQEQANLCKRGWTNNVFCVENNNKVLYYLPAYLRLKVKNIVSMDLFTLTGQVNCTFILSFSYANMDPQAVEFLSNSIQIAFHKSDALVLNSENLEVGRKDDQNKKLLTFTIRKAIAAKLQGDIFWSPFQTVRFIISLTMRSLKTTIDGKNYLFKFNLMSCDDIETKFSLAEQWSFGIFRIAENMLEVHYTNQFSYHKKVNISKPPKVSPLTYDSEINLQKSKVKLIIEDELQPLAMKTTVQNFQYAHFVLPAYKKPNPAILTIYFPLLLLGVINIGIFFQNNLQTGKIMLNISALLVSFIALIPTVRQNTPISPTVTFTQILVFLESFTTLLTLGHMIQYRNQGDLDEDVGDGYVIACIVITSFVALCILVMILLHKFYWKRQYHKSKKEKGNFKFEHKKWYNDYCDKYYFNEVEGIEDFLDQVQQSNVKRLQSKQTRGDFE